MKTTIDGAGRVVIPKELRDRLGLTAGTHLEIVECDGGLEIQPVPTPMKLVKKGKDLFAVPLRDDLPPLTDETVRETIERIRR